MVLPVTAFFTEPRAIYILLSSGILFVALSVGLAIVLPKLVSVAYSSDATVKSLANQAESPKVDRSAVLAICNTCGGACAKCEAMGLAGPVQSFADASQIQ